MTTPSDLSRHRSGQRRALLIVLLGATTAVSCLLLDPPALAERPAVATSREAAPAEPAIRPNPPTEPVAGLRVSGLPR